MDDFYVILFCALQLQGNRSRIYDFCRYLFFLFSYIFYRHYYCCAVFFQQNEMKLYIFIVRGCQSLIALVLNEDLLYKIKHEQHSAHRAHVEHKKWKKKLLLFEMVNYLQKSGQFTLARISKKNPVFLLYKYTLNVNK